MREVICSGSGTASGSRIASVIASHQPFGVGVFLPTGVVHFDDGTVRITADLPKRIEWDQKKLTDIVRRIIASGEDPKQ